MTNTAKKCLWVLAAIAVVATMAVAAQQKKKRETPVTAISYHMNTMVEYRLYGKQAQQAYQAIEAELQGLEDAFSMHLPESEISRLNAAAGGAPVEVSAQVMQLLQACVRYGEESDGAFDVTVAPLVEEWGIQTDHAHVPSQDRIDALLSLVDYRSLRLKESDGVYTAQLPHAGQAVDLGGIVKGYACTIAREIAENYKVTGGYVSIGGNIMTIGSTPQGRPFRFGLRDPRGSANDFIGVFEIPGETIATSGDYERYFEQDGVRYHHILNPATGYPADGGLLSVSVISPDGAYADYMSTRLFIMGREYALKNLNNFNCGLVLIDQQRRVYVSDNMKERFTPDDPTGTYRFEETA